MSDFTAADRTVQGPGRFAEVVALRPCPTAEGELDGCAESREILDAHVARLAASIDRDRDTLTRLRDRQRHMTPRL